MGLDITAYKNVKLLRACAVQEANAAEERDDETNENVTLLYDGEWRGDGLVDGFYEFSGEERDFRAGSYGGYNQWRDQLAQLVGTSFAKVSREKGASAGPFVELIWFSDCEGFIGPQTSAKLARDFAEHQAKADAFAGEDGEWFRARYVEWRKAFELAAGEGVVKFH